MLIIVLLAASLNATRGGHPPHYSKLPQYLWGMAWEWILPGLIWLGIRNRVSLRALIGGRGRTMEEFPRDVIYAALFWICALGVLGLGAKLMHLDQAGSKACEAVQVSHTRTRIWNWLSGFA